MDEKKNASTRLARTLITAFIDEDDSLIQVVLWLLDIYTAVKAIWVKPDNG